MGTIIAIAFSYVAYRMARRTGRSVVLWIVLVWILGTIGGGVFALFGSALDVLFATEEAVKNETIEPYLAFWASGAGTVIGCGIAALMAGRRQPTASIDHALAAAIVSDSPPSAPPGV